MKKRIWPLVAYNNLGSLDNISFKKLLQLFVFSIRQATYTAMPIRHFHSL
jgi:hypothetical protein